MEKNNISKIKNNFYQIKKFKLYNLNIITFLYYNHTIKIFC